MNRNDIKPFIFNTSKECSLGVELEFQIINPSNYDLIAGSKTLLKKIQHNIYAEQIKPEITRSMIELNSSIHDKVFPLYGELIELKSILVKHAKELGLLLAGGGSHPFQKWVDRQIFPSPRYEKISKLYGYLAKQVTVFGEHIHIGCKNGDDAIYLAHIFARYLPHFIALSASSPFYQGVDTKFDSVRVNITNTFPNSGFIPYVQTWDEFSVFFKKMRGYKIVETMKDFYWDIRPKPEFGTVELRICDTPLTIEKAVMLAAYAQTLARYILHERPFPVSQEIYMLYNFNRFHAARFGLNGEFINPHTEKHCKINEDILATLELLEAHATHLGTNSFIDQVTENVKSEQNDAKWLRQTFAKVGSLPELVHAQSELLMKNN